MAMQRWTAAVLAFGLATAAASPSRAQTTPTATPFPAPVSPAGDSAVPFSGFRLSSPIRLSLEGSVFPRAGEFANCATLGDDAGNSVGGIPLQRYVEWSITPRLVLSGFSQGGCPIDAGVGGAMTYSVPLRAGASLVFGAGLYAAPGQFPLWGGAASVLSLAAKGAYVPAAASLRADVVWQDRKENPYHVGIQAVSPGRAQVVFGGGF
jgi:hypothetical protein